ncbi:MAG: mannose-1-phosphate guanylyltransferase/mannose-6-phosphate isomerase [Burkholderiales bacterium]|nr:mannose-1-phosphate guanylyltransferase/mannose-6-phosphate isomerase [Burkholderiales bacterium]
MKVVPIILSGGVGARLWPVSRETHPKPFIKLADGESLLQKAFSRAKALPHVAEILTVTNRELYFKTRDEYRAVNAGQVATSYILEPFGRNTAPAIAAAANYVAETYGDDAILVVLPADHLIEKRDAFLAAVNDAIELAKRGLLVTFGIQPTFPETGFGYIESEGNKVHRFVEKPSLEKAQEYLASGRYLWNAGMFCFKASTFLDELDRCAHDIASAVRKCVNASEKIMHSSSMQIELDAALFKQVPDLSVDYAVMERSQCVAVVPCDFGWSDIGSWSALSALVPADEHGNSWQGDVMLRDSSDCYVQSERRLVSGVGLENLIIIDTADALLIVDRNKVQDVKKVVEHLKAMGHPAYREHQTMHRPWGTYTVIEQGDRFKIKRIEVKPGASLSLQMHHHRSEHWVVVSGQAKVVNGDQEFFVNTNESTFIPAGHKHRLENPGQVELVMIEVQCGDYLGEDDIVRFEDHYGRVK